MSIAEAAPAGAAPSADDPQTAYDRIAYPSTVMRRLDPDRLAVMARLHGIATPPTATARVLEVGGGDGINLTAFAAARPEAQCLNFDLAAVPVARGQALARVAGIDNIRIERMDIIDAAETLPGEYDYILVHGVYAWVPAPVRDAIFRLIGRVLAPNGLALVSYNALPGQVFSQTLREMVFAEVGDVPEGEELVDRAIELLKRYAEPSSDTNVFASGLRKRAEDLLKRPRALLAHDEFGSHFAPQTFTAVCEAAAVEGLTYLNDALHLSWEQGFGGDLDEAARRKMIQMADHRFGCGFRHSIFVRDGLPINRQFDSAAASTLWLSSNAQPDGNGKFLVDGESFDVADQRMVIILQEAARLYPKAFPLAGLDDERMLTFVRLFLGRAIKLGTDAGRAGSLSARPKLNALARAQIERGDTFAAGLDQSMTQLSADFSRLLLLLDGTRDAEALAAEVGFGVAEAMAFMGMTEQRALLAL